MTYGSDVPNVASALAHIEERLSMRTFDRKPIEHLHTWLTSHVRNYQSGAELDYPLQRALSCGSPQCAPPGQKLERLVRLLKCTLAPEGVVREDDRTFLRLVLREWKTRLQS